MSFEARKAQKQKAKIRLGLSSVSGGGKTYSSLLIAKGLVGEWEKVYVIDGENNSADFYSDLGGYNVVPMTPPFSPERYVQAIEYCEKQGAEVIIIDSFSQCWEGEGGILSLADQLGGQYQTAWKQLTPRYEKLKQKIILSKCHMITTTRRKQDYDMVKDQNGKTKVVKVGLKEITREGWEYELTINLELDTNHNATASKDRTQLFPSQVSFIPTEQTGKLIQDWCNKGIEPIALPPTTPAPQTAAAELTEVELLEIKDLVSKCGNGNALTNAFKSLSADKQGRQIVKDIFNERREELKKPITQPA